MKSKKYLFGKILCTVVIVICILTAAVYGAVGLFASKQLDAGRMPQLGSTSFIAVTDDQFSDKVHKNALVFGKTKNQYAAGDIVAVSLNESDLVSVSPNTCADIAVVQIVQVNGSSCTVAYNDVSAPFFVSADAVLANITSQSAGLGRIFVWMLAPMGFLFWLILPALLILLCSVLLAYLREKSIQSMIEESQQVPDDVPVLVVPDPMGHIQPASDEPEKSDHPIFSGRLETPSFPKKEDDFNLEQEIARKTEAILHAEQEKLAETQIRKETFTGAAPSEPVTTVVYQVGTEEEEEKKTESSQPKPTPEDLDLMILQDKIENIIHTNNRRLENEVEQKLRGMSTEKEEARRELEKTREFFISPSHNSKNKKDAKNA